MLYVFKSWFKSNQKIMTLARWYTQKSMTLNRVERIDLHRYADISKYVCGFIYMSINTCEIKLE